MTGEEKRTFNSVVLGALLHDIGKFMQRAHDGNKDLPVTSREAEQNLCPLYKGRYSHSHVLWTDAFYEWLQRENLPFPDAFDFMTAKKASIFHHQPDHHEDPTIGWIVAEADRLSSGMDRKEKDLEAELASGRTAFKKIPLMSVFDRMNLGRHERTDRFFYPLKRLSDFDGIFPDEMSPPFTGTLGYRGLWGPFLADFKKVCDNQRQDIFFNALVSLLEEYLWTIPSSTMDLPDISLYDHSITTAAIAAVLCRYHMDTGTMNTGQVRDRNCAKFRIVAGDLSGIQKYIFRLRNESVKGVNKILRARSFYIGSISEMASHWLLRRLGLPDMNKVMDAGGRFLLLIPNTEGAQGVLANSVKIIERWMKTEFQGELALNIDFSTTASGRDFDLKEGAFASLIDRVNDRIELRKNKKFSSIGGPCPPIFPIHYTEQGSCGVCGVMPAMEGSEAEPICGTCRDLKELGRRLTHAGYIAYPEKKKADDRHILAFFEDNCFLAVGEDKEDLLSLNPSMLFRTGEDLDGLPGKHLANYIPRFDEKDQEKVDTLYRDLDDPEDKNITPGQPKTFHHLAAEAKRMVPDSGRGEKITGRDFLGILKADVDNLGILLSIGLEEETGNDLSISRFSFMTRMLNLFFTGYLQRRMERDYPSVYTVFSGGDDLFFIGPWWKIIEFAGEINKQFRRFTCRNHDITLSAGIELIKARYPVNRGASMVENALDQSKDKGKGRLTLFQTTIEWERLPGLLEYGRSLEKACESDDSSITTGLVYRLLRYHTMEENIRNRKYRDRDFLWRSHLSYDRERNTKTKEDKALLRRLEGGEYEPDALMPYLKIPVFWTLYRNRN